jgi:hypothetical protein
MHRQGQPIRPVRRLRSLRCMVPIAPARAQRQGMWRGGGTADIRTASGMAYTRCRTALTPVTVRCQFARHIYPDFDMAPCIALKAAPTRVACSARPHHTTRASSGRVAAAAKPSRVARLSLYRNAFSELVSGASARRNSGVCHAAGDDGSEQSDGNVTMITSADEWRDALSNAGDKLVRTLSPTYAIPTAATVRHALF